MPKRLDVEPSDRLQSRQAEATKMGRRDGSPIWVQEGDQGTMLRRADLTGKVDGAYSEAWLQRILHHHPEVLPIEQIEPGFGNLISVCRELPLAFGAGKSGALDNLFVTSSGGLVLVEAKLWRNPEARRTVVAQAMEYAAAVFRMDYQAFDAAIGIARKAAGEPASTLAALAAVEGEAFDEAAFIDTVSRNLRRGRAVVAVVGDGIREDILPLAELLQSHAGQRFVFALIELGVYETPAPGVRIVSPSILAQTTLIERGVVRVDDVAGVQSSRVTIDPPSAPPTTSAKSQAFSLSEDEFFDLLDQRESGLSGLLKNFLARGDAHGIYPDRQGGLNIKHLSPQGPPLNLGTIDKGGFLETGPATWWNRGEAGRVYNETIAKLIGGFVREQSVGQQSVVRTAAGKTPRLSDLLPRHEEAWLDAIDAYVATFFTANS